jgi:hypothetical protein
MHARAHDPLPPNSPSRRFSNDEYMEVYRVCYFMCIQKAPHNYSELLYEKHGAVSQRRWGRRRVGAGRGEDGSAPDKGTRSTPPPPPAPHRSASGTTCRTR